MMIRSKQLSLNHLVFSFQRVAFRQLAFDVGTMVLLGLCHWFIAIKMVVNETMRPRVLIPNAACQVNSEAGNTMHRQPPF